MSGVARFSLPAVLAVLVAGPLVTACGGTETFEVSDPWARPTAPGAEMGAIYFVADNGTDVDDALVAATSPWCDEIELHTTDTRDGVMSMYPATDEQLVVPAGGELVAEPGGLHLMCVGLTQPIVEGEPVEVTVTFATAGDVALTASAEHR